MSEVTLAIIAGTIISLHMRFAPVHHSVPNIAKTSQTHTFASIHIKNSCTFPLVFTVQLANHSLYTPFNAH